MADRKIQDIEGIGPKHGEALEKIGITSTDKMLVPGSSTPKGRKQMAEQCGISEKVILRCVNMCDLFRIKGVASQYAELLEASGVDTVKVLRNRNAENLAQKMSEVNASKKLTRQTPSVKMVVDWVEQAKSLPPVVTY